ncbi:MAG: methyltransferase [Bacteroidetes bacterium]|nr:methyltransferase [Bacteroidota bacterium]
MQLIVPPYKRLLSYLYPVLIRKGSDTNNSLLQLLLYRNQYQLASNDALYSDGTRYRPVVEAFKRFESELPNIKNALVLGCGLGSTVHILSSKGHHPNYTLVDIDKTVLSWALELMPTAKNGNINPVIADARQFVETHNHQYDLVVIDVFVGRIVPGFVTTPHFLNKCRSFIKAGGRVVINYMINNDGDWRVANEHIRQVFPGIEEIQLGVNRVFVAKV